jgi:hypothetical protein
MMKTTSLLSIKALLSSKALEISEVVHGETIETKTQDKIMTSNKPNLQVIWLILRYQFLNYFWSFYWNSKLVDHSDRPCDLKSYKVRGTLVSCPSHTPLSFTNFPLHHYFLG